ncbi:MAG TPA: YcnI family protein [Solirubrobacteraceae bacterium]|nr:YcnI family protein [Solirubrobacteraceae bacterium]
MFSALLWSAVAQAHVSIHPNTLPAGAFATLDVRVPGEEADAHITKIAMLFPPGFSDVSYEPVSGWKVRTVERKLGSSSEIARVEWTWSGPLGEVGDSQFVQLPLAVAIPEDAAGKALEFRTVQTYSNGHVEHWIDPSLDAEHPSPRINVIAKGGAIEDIAGEEAGPTAGQDVGSSVPSASAPPVAQSSNGASKGLAITALILGALGLLLGGVALARGRRP